MRFTYCIMTVMIPAACLTADDGLRAEVAPGEFSILNREGTRLWHLRSPAAQEPSISPMPHGGWLVNDGVVVSPKGQVTARHETAPAGTPSTRGGEFGCPLWDNPAEVTPPPGGASDSHAPLLMTGEGDAWVVNTHINSGNYALQVRTFDRDAGAWDAMQTISDSTRYVSQPEGTIDPDDNLTIVFRDIDQGYHLYAIRYEPAAGWGELTPVYSTSTFFQAIEIASDEDGDVVVINDLGLSTKRVRSVFYDADSGDWSDPVQVSPLGYSTLLPTLARNDSGTGVYLVYMVLGGGPPGLYAHRWDSDANAWGSAQFLPDSQTVGFDFAGPSSRFPVAVDGAGEATVLWQSDPPLTINASRTAGGAWQAPRQLLAPSPHDTDIENFSYIDANAAGDVMGVITRYEGGLNRFYAFRYDFASGWRQAENPYTSTLNTSTRVRASFHNGARAVATFMGSQTGQRQLTSMNYDGLNWEPSLLDIPEVHDAFFQRIIDDRGEALLVYEAEQGGSNLGIKATWLRRAVGDFNCNGNIDLDDFVNYFACVGGPGVPVSIGCRPADLDGDGDTDLNDLAFLQRVFGN